MALSEKLRVVKMVGFHTISCLEFSQYDRLPPGARKIPVFVYGQDQPIDVFNPKTMQRIQHSEIGRRTRCLGIRLPDRHINVRSMWCAIKQHKVPLKMCHAPVFTLHMDRWAGQENPVSTVWVVQPHEYRTIMLRIFYDVVTWESRVRERYDDQP